MELPSIRRRAKAAPHPDHAQTAAVAVRAKDAANGGGKRRARNQVAAAAVLDDMAVGWKNFKFGTQTWQTEVWRHYDITGELKSPARAIASMASRCILNIVEIDEQGLPGQPATDAKYAKMSAEMMGGPDERPELLYLAALNEWLVGELYTYIETPKGSDTDRWMILSGTQIKKAGADPKLEFDRPLKYGGGKIEYWIPEGKDKAKDAARIRLNTGLLIRTWTPHGQLTDHADAGTRSVISVLNLIEQYNKRSSAQNDSRLAGAGVLFLPDSFEFPLGDHKSPEDAFEATLGDAMGTTLRDHANARSLVPIMATVEAEDIDKIKWLTFETPLDDQTMERLDQCIRRLALGLDMPPELLLGTGTLNHWNAWMSEATTHKGFIAPLLQRICHGLTEGWLQRVDPSSVGRYMVWFDMGPLTVQPNRQEDALAMYDRGLINAEAARRAGNWSEDDANTPDQLRIWAALNALRADPTMIGQAGIAEALGFKPIKIEQAQPALEAGAGGPAALEARPQGAAALEAPGGGGTAPTTATAASANQTAAAARLHIGDALFTGVEIAALHSLSVAGKKLITRKVRNDPTMGEFAGRTHELHTRLQVEDSDHARSLLAGTMDLIPALAARTGVDWRILTDVIEFYAVGRMLQSEPHDPWELLWHLQEGITAAGHQHCTGEACTNKLNLQPCGVGS
jgi:hypothetical protein